MINFNIKKIVRTVLLILGVIFILSLFINKATYSHKETEYTNIKVAYGDTLWGIATDLQKNNQVYKNKDVRYIIEDIKSINKLESSSLYTSQELLIPIG